MTDLNGVMDIIVNRIKAMRIAVWDVYCISTDTYENQFRQYDIEITRQAVNFYYILRTFYRKGEQFGVGVIKANSVKPAHIDTYLKKSQELAKLNKSSKYDLPQPGQTYPHLKLAEEKVVANPEGVLSDTSEKIRSIVQDLKQVKPTFGKLRIYISSMALRNNEGIALNDRKSSFFLEYPLKAEEAGKLAEYWGLRYFKNSAQLDLQNRLSRWAEITVDSLHAKTPKMAKSMTVIFHPKLVCDALSNTVGYHSTGAAIYDGVSKFQKGATVASDKFSLTDNGLMEDGIFVGNWDGEGNPQRHTPLIKNGVFQNFLYDQKYAALEKNKSTGNGLRNTNGTILNSVTNLEIEPGSESLEELIASTKYGVCIEEFSWLNPTEETGFFGSEIRNGYLIENGKKTCAIKGGNLSGNTFEMIRAIEGVSKERIIESNYKFPYIKFSGLILSS